MKKLIHTVLPFLLIGVFAALLLFLPWGERTIAKEKTVVEVWNVDTFEGGKGSRTAFLNKMAQKMQADGVYFYVLNYTIEGAREAFSRGVYPDMLSFGVGLGEIAERCMSLPYAFSGGEIGGTCLSVPWCAGKYFRFSLSDDFSETGSTAVSCGRSNLSVLAARLNGIAGEETPSERAYVGFLNGEFRYLLGTQRDENRFRARNVTVYSEELKEYNDLFQYMCILSGEKREICLQFLAFLLSQEVQDRLGDIGMYPPQEAMAKKTLCVFSSDASLGELAAAARGGSEINFLEKYLKSR